MTEITPSATPVDPATPLLFGLASVLAMVGVLFLVLAAAKAIRRRGRRRTIRPRTEPGPRPVAGGRLAERSPNGRRWPRRRRAPAADEPLVRPLVIVPSLRSWAEPPLGERVLARARVHHEFFFGRCETEAGLPDLVVRGAALIGSGHTLDRVPGQDVVGSVWAADGGRLYVAVADGLGSLAESDVVAQLVVRRSLALAAEHAANNQSGTLDSVVKKVFSTVAEDAMKLLRQGEGRARSGASTLVLVEIMPIPGGAVISGGGIGDSEAWLLSSGSWRVLHHERDDSDGSATRDVPRHRDPLVVEALQVPIGSVLLIGSDGFVGSLGTKTSILADELARRWVAPPSPIDYLNHVNFVDDYWTDDRAALAVWIG